MTSGKDSPQYKAVLGHFDVLVDTIKVTSGTENSLRRKFQMQKWLGIASPASADELIRTALTRIANDVKEYGVFIGMLQDITELKHMADKITGK